LYGLIVGVKVASATLKYEKFIGRVFLFDRMKILLFNLFKRVVFEKKSIDLHAQFNLLQYSWYVDFKLFVKLLIPLKIGSNTITFVKFIAKYLSYKYKTLMPFFSQ